MAFISPTTGRKKRRPNYGAIFGARARFLPEIYAAEEATEATGKSLELQEMGLTQGRELDLASIASSENIAREGLAATKELEDLRREQARVTAEENLAFSKDAAKKSNLISGAGTAFTALTAAEKLSGGGISAGLSKLFGGGSSIAGNTALAAAQNTAIASGTASAVGAAPTLAAGAGAGIGVNYGAQGAAFLAGKGAAAGAGAGGGAGAGAAGAAGGAGIGLAGAAGLGVAGLIIGAGSYLVSRHRASSRERAQRGYYNEETTRLKNSQVPSTARFTAPGVRNPFNVELGSGRVGIGNSKYGAVSVPKNIIDTLRQQGGQNLPGTTFGLQNFGYTPQQLQPIGDFISSTYGGYDANRGLAGTSYNNLDYIQKINRIQDVASGLPFDVSPEKLYGQLVGTQGGPGGGQDYRGDEAFQRFQAKRLSEH